MRSISKAEVDGNENAPHFTPHLAAIEKNTNVFSILLREFGALDRVVEFD